MSAYYILAIDQGTTSTRAILFDQEQHIIAMAQEEFPQYFPEPGWVEHDAEQIWQSVLSVCRKVIQQSYVDPKLILGLGISNQRETTVLWDRKTSQVIGPAIVWQDRRTASFFEKLKAEGSTQWLQQKTGLLADPYFSASKIQWLLDNIPEARKKAEQGELAFGTIESFLIWRFTQGAVHVSDVTNASRTLLMDIHTRQWDSELCKFFTIPESLLPTIVGNATTVGKTHVDIFGVEIAICGMAGDQQAALIGQACVLPGMLKTTLGTGAFLMLNTGKDLIISQHQLLSTVAYEVNGEVAYALEGSIFNAGTIVKWLRDQLNLIDSAEETESLVRSVVDNGGVYFVPAFTGLGAPYWNPDVRGDLSGLTRATTKAHIVRASLEAIAYQLHDVQLAMYKDTNKPIIEMRIDGGMTVNHWLLQFMANILQIPVLLTAQQEASCYGAGILAAIGAGCFDNLQTANQQWHASRKFLPAITESMRDKLYTEWLKAVRRLLA